MNPRTPYQAKFSLAYCVAAALLEGTLGLEQFAEERFRSTALGASGAEGVRDSAIAELLRRSRVTVADDLTAKYPGGVARATDAVIEYRRDRASGERLSDEATLRIRSRTGSWRRSSPSSSARASVTTSRIPQRAPCTQSSGPPTSQHSSGDWGTWEGRSTSSLGFNRMAAGVACAEIRRSHRKCRIIGYVWSRSDRWSH